MQAQQQSPVNLAKIKNILKLEQLFHNKFLTVELVHELISLYTCCIEAIDQKQQEIRVYFLDKIQFVLSRPEVQALLNVVNNGCERMVGTLRETLRVTEIQQVPTHVKTQSLAPNFDRKRLHNYDGDNPDEKKKKIDIQLKLMNEMEMNMKNLSTQVQAADNKLQEDQKIIKNITNEQNSRLEQRRLQRKNKKRRKSSVDKRQQGTPVKIQKKQLLKAQAQINDSVIRITIRATQRNRQNQNKKMEEKVVIGRVKNLKRMESDD